MRVIDDRSGESNFARPEASARHSRRSAGARIQIKLKVEIPALVETCGSAIHSGINFETIHSDAYISVVDQMSC